ncbi:hypothetical protein G3435_07055 [Pseudomonas sp. MAFF212428]|uniref:Uncharacterized protein n=1 Tax=Pseudomonas brassicae TaxID=2708063 RepID=A0A6B3NUH3_9PSED|nr:hypothetical protein [Pseudomonas brassicae]NER59808.1 hypothetical protein [Pseudomonas brassicae]NER65423.1 hypothetical protein [Pseudomonas brassicae]
MIDTQHTKSGQVLIHPTTCHSLQKIYAFELRTGLKVITTPTGPARAIPMHTSGGAA